MAEVFKPSFSLALSALILAGGLTGCDRSHHKHNASTNTGPSAYINDEVRTVTSGHNVTLTGFAEHTTGTVSYKWLQDDGSEMLTLTGADTTSVSFTAPTLDASGACTEALAFSFSVTDTVGTSDEAQTTLEVLKPGHPLVTILNNPRTVSAGETVTLHAQGSDNSSGTWSWEQVGPIDKSKKSSSTLLSEVTLTNANSSSPEFTVPANTPDLTYRFRVDYSDGSCEISDFAEVIVHQPNTDSPDNATKRPLSVGSGISESTPKQALQLASPPDVVTVAGSDIKVTMPVSGGTQPYNWTWTQDNGTSATLAGANTAVLTVTIPASITTAEVLTFKAEVTDDAGSGDTQEGLVRVRVLPTPSSGTLPANTVVTQQTPKVATSEHSFTINTLLSNPSVHQTGGRDALIDIATTPNADGSITITVTPSTVSADTENMEIVIEGTNQDGKTEFVRIPIVVHRAPSQSGATPPVVVSPTAVPTLYEVLQVTNCGATSADSGQQDVVLGICATGGTGSYTYQWTELPSSDPDAPTLSLSDTSISHPEVDIPTLTASTLVGFQVVVTSGGQSVTKDDLVLHLSKPIENLGAANLADIKVGSAHEVSLHAPTVSGGVPPYTITVSQGSTADDISYPVSAGSSANQVFTAPTLSSGNTATLTFTFAITDATGRSINAQQNVIVTSSASALTAEIKGPSEANAAEAFHLSASVTGGNSPYTYSWEIAPANGDASIPTITPDANENPEITIADVPSGNRTEYLVTLTVTDSLADTVDAAEFHLNVNLTDAVRAKHIEVDLEAELDAAVATQGASEATIAPLLESAAVELEALSHSLITKSIVTPTNQAALDQLGAQPLNGNDACIDTFLGDCAVDFDGMCADEFVQGYCARHCNICTPATATMKADYESALQSLTP